MSELGTAQSAQLLLQSAMQEVQNKGQELQTALYNVMSALTFVTTQCNNFFTGVGPQREYLLDICTQTGSRCMEEPQGRHTGCCCAYNPVLALGKVAIPSNTIPGLSDDGLDDGTGEARVAAPRRAAATQPNVFDICGDSWTDARARIQAAQAAVRAEGQQHLTTLSNQALVEAYPGSTSPFVQCLVSKCNLDTGGTCRFGSCHPSRGPTTCESGRCLCADGYCAQSGNCVGAAALISGAHRNQIPHVLGAAAIALGLASAMSGQ